MSGSTADGMGAGVGYLSCATNNSPLPVQGARVRGRWGGDGRGTNPRGQPQVPQVVETDGVLYGSLRPGHRARASVNSVRTRVRDAVQARQLPLARRLDYAERASSTRCVL